LVTRLGILVVGILVGLAVLAAASTLMGGSNIGDQAAGDNLTPDGRLQLFMDVDAEDEFRNPRYYQGYCEADAVALLQGTRVEAVQRVGTNVVEVDELVVRTTREDSIQAVYRDAEGNLREGCAPGSADSFRIVEE